MDMTSRSVSFPSAYLGSFHARLAVLATTAARLGVEPMTATEVPDSRRMVTDVGAHGFRFTYEEVTMTLVGTTPRLPGGWTFVGAVEHLEAGNLLHGDDDAMGAYRHAGATCDHCQLARMRKMTMVLRSDAGNVTQVGSTCLKDFLGYHGSPEALLAYADELDGEESEGPGFAGWRNDKAPTMTVMAMATAVVRTHGWASKGSVQYGGGTATADVVGAMLGLAGRLTERDHLFHLVAAVESTLTDEAQAALVMDFARALPDSGNEYLTNLAVVLAGDWLNFKHLGLAVSAVSAYHRANADTVAKEVAAKSVAVGTVGDKVVLDVTVTKVTPCDTRYGTTMLVTMVDAEGNSLKTFAAGSFGTVAEAGKALTVAGTVKEHETYNGVVSTMLGRCKVFVAKTAKAPRKPVAA